MLIRSLARMDPKLPSIELLDFIVAFRDGKLRTD
jgi:hypothetical protein